MDSSFETLEIAILPIGFVGIFFCYALILRFSSSITYVTLGKYTFDQTKACKKGYITYFSIKRENADAIIK